MAESPLDHRRGEVLKACFAIKYPDDNLALCTINLKTIKRMIFDHSVIQSTLQQLGVSPTEWTTDDWHKNPTILVERKDGLYIMWCQYTGHENGHHPAICTLRGPVVYPIGYKRYLDENEAENTTPIVR